MPLHPPLWPGLLLNLLLPGSGFTYLGRPWWHLGALLLTLLDWLAAWTLLLHIGNRQISSRTALPQPLFTGMILLGLLMMLAAYVSLTWQYFRLYRRPSRSNMRPGARWMLTGAHLCAVLGIVWSYYHL